LEDRGPQTFKVCDLHKAKIIDVLHAQQRAQLEISCPHEAPLPYLPQQLAMPGH